MADMLDNLPDIPVPDEAPDTSVKDEFQSGVKFAVIGSGQGGSRIAASLHKLGYRRVCCLNTAEQDLEHIPLPATSKLNIGGGGAGKNPGVARQVFLDKREDVLDFMRRCFSTDFDRTIVCAGLGGGTGAGTVVELVKTARDLQDQLKCPSKKVAVIAALPKASEGKKVHENAFLVLNALFDMVEKGEISPLVLLDNERINGLYPGLSVNNFWDRANDSVTTLFHLFNLISAKSSPYSSLDVADYKTLLDSGFMTFGATPVKAWNEVTSISYAIRDNLRRNILSGGVDLATGTIAGCVVVGSDQILQSVPQAFIDHACEQLNRLLSGQSTVHRGIYSGSKESLVVYTAIGGLGRPKAKLEELRRLGDVIVKDKPGGQMLGESS